MNSVILIGRLTKDLEVKELDKEGAVARFSLAVNRGWKNADGETEADFIDITLWNDLAKHVAEYCKKGDLIAVKGRLQNNNYEKEDGTKVYSLTVVAEKVTFLQNKKESEA